MVVTESYVKSERGSFQARSRDWCPSLGFSSYNVAWRPRQVSRVVRPCDEASDDDGSAQGCSAPLTGDLCLGATCRLQGTADPCRLAVCRSGVEHEFG